MHDEDSKLPVEVGQTIGPYRLDSVLGLGGMGVVYAGCHTVLQRRVAVKVLHERLLVDSEYLSRFQFEARVVNDIHHPNIVDIHDFIQVSEPRPLMAYVMELLHGRPLSEALAHGPMAEQQTRNLGIQLADALRAVHRAGVVHRDLKPDNLMLVHGLEADFERSPAVKILDFGIAKSARATADHQTATGMVLGTPPYMAPEQILSDEVAPGTDVYALCEILYECLAGERLFVGDRAQMLRAKLNVGSKAVALPDALEHRAVWADLIQRGVAFEKADRPSADELLDTLTRMPGAPIPPLAVTSSEPPPPPPPVDSGATTVRTGVRALAAWGAVFVVCVVFGLCAVTVVLFVERTQPAPIAAPGRRPVEVPVDIADRTTAQAESPTPAPATRESSPSRPKARRPRRVQRIRVMTRPSGAEVFDGQRSLGVTPLMVRVERGAAKTLRFERRGCASRTENISRRRTVVLACEAASGDRTSVESEDELKPW